MIDWKTIEGHDCKHDESILLLFDNGEWDKGWYANELPEIFNSFVDGAGNWYDYIDGDGYYTTSDIGDGEECGRACITHYARVNGPGEPNPLRDVYRRDEEE